MKTELLKHYGREILGWVLFKLFYSFLKPKHSILSVYFHDLTPGQLKNILSWFKKQGYQFISTLEFEAILKEKGALPQKKVLLTIDDGWKANLHLLPILEAYGAPVTIFIPTQPILDGNYWWEYASLPNQEKITGVANLPAFKKLSNTAFNLKIASLKQNYTLTRTALTQAEVIKISEHPLVTIGAHTVTHPILTNQDFATQQFEVLQSKTILESWIGKEVKYFAYPNGDYNQNTLNIMQDSGYKLAFTVHPSFINPRQLNPFRIPRFPIDEDRGYYENLAKITGAWQIIFRKREKSY